MDNSTSFDYWNVVNISAFAIHIVNPISLVFARTSNAKYRSIPVLFCTQRSQNCAQNLDKLKRLCTDRDVLDPFIFSDSWTLQWSLFHQSQCNFGRDCERWKAKYLIFKKYMTFFVFLQTLKFACQAISIYSDLSTSKQKENILSDIICFWCQF